MAALIDHAARIGASDLFFAYNENHVAVSVRHLGIVRLVTVLAMEHGRRCTSYIKAMAGMDLAEQRRPLDGRWVRGEEVFLFGDDEGDEDEEDDGEEETWPELQRRSPTVTGAGRIDLRVSTIPTLHGEDMAIRLLVGTPQVTALDQLGMSPRELNELGAMIEIPSGLILVSGPTGSGKTTTLYACLRHLNNGERKINTIEDPIEYSIPGLRQSQINPKADVGFPELLRSLLRQAPDVILIGEIPRRDHGRDRRARRQQRAPGAGVGARALGAGGRAEPDGAWASTQHSSSPGSLQGVIAQRLVRTLCPGCKAAFDLGDTPEGFEEVRAWLEPGEGQALHGARGCRECLQTGYSGRTGVFEVLRVTRELRRLIADGRPTGELRDAAARAGLLDLRRAALLKVARGQTNAEEVLRAIPPEELGLDG